MRTRTARRPRCRLPWAPCLSPTSTRVWRLGGGECGVAATPGRSCCCGSGGGGGCRPSCRFCRAQAADGVWAGSATWSSSALNVHESPLRPVQTPSRGGCGRRWRSGTACPLSTCWCVPWFCSAAGALLGCWLQRSGCALDCSAASCYYGRFLLRWWLCSISEAACLSSCAAGSSVRLSSTCLLHRCAPLQVGCSADKLIDLLLRCFRLVSFVAYVRQLWPAHSFSAGGLRRRRADRPADALRAG